MKDRQKKSSDELRPEYRFDYSVSVAKNNVHFLVIPAEPRIHPATRGTWPRIGVRGDAAVPINRSEIQATSITRLTQRLTIPILKSNGEKRK
jgi:hypothetical protein